MSAVPRFTSRIHNGDMGVWQHLLVAGRPFPGAPRGVAGRADLSPAITPSGPSRVGSIRVEFESRNCFLDDFRVSLAACDEGL